MDKILKKQCSIDEGYRVLWGKNQKPIYVLDPMGDITVNVKEHIDGSIFHNTIETVGVCDSKLSYRTATNTLLLGKVNRQLFGKGTSKVLSINITEMKSPLPDMGNSVLYSSDVVMQRTDVLRLSSVLNCTKEEILKYIYKLVGASITTSDIELVNKYLTLLADNCAKLYSRRMVLTKYNPSNLSFAGHFIDCDKLVLLPDYRNIILASDGLRVRDSIVKCIDDVRSLLSEKCLDNKRFGLSEASSLFNDSLKHHLLFNVGFTKEHITKLSDEAIFKRFSDEYMLFLTEKTNDDTTTELDANHFRNVNTYGGKIGRNWVYGTDSIYNPVVMNIPMSNLGKNILTLLSSEDAIRMRTRSIIATTNNCNSYAKLFSVATQPDSVNVSIDFVPYVIKNRMESFDKFLSKYCEEY